MKNNITLKNPWVLDISEKFEKQLSQFGGDVEKLKEFYNKIGFENIPYDGIKRWGLDSSTESSDIKISDIKEGYEMWWRRWGTNGFGWTWTLIRVTHIYNGIMFFETIGLKKKITSCFDTGANDLEWSSKNPSRYSLPSHKFYPIEVIKPEWVNIGGWNAPKQMVITNKDE